MYRKKFLIFLCVSSSSNRIVVYGETMSNAIVPNSAKSFNLQQEFKLTDEEVRLTYVFSELKGRNDLTILL